MILYHGSYIQIEKPNLSFSRKELDFGIGFYTTSIKEQAEKWSLKFKKRKQASVISKYEFDEKNIEKASVLKFDSYSDEWLDFVILCRTGKKLEKNYDLVIGGIANDDVFNTLQLFLDNLIPKQETLKRLRYERPNIQYCFKSQAIIDEHLHFMESYEI
ncbi:MAG: DUF3990 domain-containing protein [Fibromonadaceae bacterium]|jgi:hypothetical protein|nr:DUF3990 domain-containing protein [Fibromonadaceae bacterium]